MKRLFAFVTLVLFTLTPLVPFTQALATAAGTNLIINPSVETASGALPTSWNHDKWGTNTAAFTYNATAGHTGTKSVSVNMTKHTSGDAKWYFSDVTVQPNTKYTYSEFYKASVATEIDTQYTSTTGALSYGYLSSPAASASAWQQVSNTFTTPANVKTMTIFHLIDKVGTVQTDDFSLVAGDGTTTPPPATPTAPAVNFTAPAANATVSGTTALSANASDAVSVAGVQFKVDGTNVGAEDTTAPYSVNLDTKALANGTHTLTATARNSSNLTTVATEAINVQNVAAPTAPAVSVTAPAANATVSGSTTVTANASDAVSVKSVQFKLDGVNLGAADTTAPYSVAWDTKAATNAQHTLTAVATNASGLTTTSAAVSVTVNNPTAPAVNITAPTPNATVSGTTNVTANASDAVGVTSVQFKLDGANLGAADTTAPYSTSWDTTKASNGLHTLTAVASNGASLSTTSTSVSVTVSNTVATPPPAGNNGPNLIANPSVETAQDTSTPASWLSSNWGTNTSTFSYLSTGHTGSRSIKVQTTAYTDGAANWYYADVPVTAGTTYQYTNWYQSNVDTEVDAEVTMSDGTVQYFYLGTVLANTNWTKFTTTFTVPAGGKSIAVYQILAKVGYIVTDDYSLNTYTPVPFNRPIVSVTFDDGWANQFQNARPVMQQDGLIGTYYIISGELTDQPEYMSGAQVKQLYADGNEIASHSVTHPDMTTLTAAKLKKEMANSQTTLQNLIGAPVKDFAYPFGAYNGNTIAVGSQYYQSQRTVNAGYNTKDNLDLTQLKIYEVDSNISQAQVQAWIDGAKATNSWLVLVYHEIATTPSDPTDDLYTTKPADFAAEMAYLKSSGIATETMQQAINEVVPQL